jgi:AcrR family transcriptional regulator
MLRPVSERDPAGGEDSAPGLGRLPPGRHGLPREFVVRNQRDRLAAGIIAAVAEHGYHEATISQIAAAAGVSRRTFYAYFSSKEECFEQTYDIIAIYLRDAARAASAEQPTWPEKVRARIATVLETFAASPDLANFALIAPPRAGSELAARYRRAMEESFAEFREGIPADARQPSQAAELALLGGAAAMVARRVEAGEAKQLPDLLPELLELVLTPYLGREAAVAAARGASF